MQMLNANAPETGGVERHPGFLKLRGPRGVMEEMVPRLRAFRPATAEGVALSGRQQLLARYEALKAMDERQLAEGLKNFLKAHERVKGQPDKSVLALAMLQFKRLPPEDRDQVLAWLLMAGMSPDQLDGLFKKCTPPIEGMDGTLRQSKTSQLVLTFLRAGFPHASLALIQTAESLGREDRLPLLERVFDAARELTGQPLWRPLIEDFLPALSKGAGEQRRKALLCFAETSGALHAAEKLPKTSVFRREAAERAAGALSDVKRLADPRKRQARLEEFRDDCRDRAPVLSAIAGKRARGDWALSAPEWQALRMGARPMPYFLVDKMPEDHVDDHMPALNRKTSREGK